MIFSGQYGEYIAGDELLLPLGLIEFEECEGREIFEWHILLNQLVVVRVVEHSISDAVFIDKLGNFALPKNEFYYFLKLVFYLRGDAVNVNKQVFIFQVGASEVQEEGPEGKVDPRLIGLVEEGDEVAIVVDFPFVFIVLIHAFFFGVQYFFAKDLGIA